MTTNESPNAAGSKEAPLVDLKFDKPAESLTKSAQDALDTARICTIDSVEMYQIAADELQKIKTLQKKVETERTTITKPMNESLRAVNAYFKPMSDWLDDAESILKTAMGTFDRLQAQKRIEEQAALERAAAAERARLEEEAAAATAKASADAEVLLKQADEAKQSGDAETAARLESQASTRVEQGAFTAQVLEQTSSLMSAPTSQVSTPKVRGVSKREVWKFEIVDPELVPREYLVIDESKIRGVVQALKGATTIPGVRAYPDSQIAARAA